MKSNKLFLLGMTFLVLSCSKVQNSCEAIVKLDCFHTQEYDPVCGCDGVTYSNSGEAECNSIVEFTKGDCSILGEWNFLGFKSDGAAVGLNKQFYSSDPMSITIQEDADNDVLFPFNGKGQPNRFNGKYSVNGSKYDVYGITEAVGSEIEIKFVGTLSKVLTTKKVGDYLIMMFVNDVDDSMIFIKK